MCPKKTQEMVQADRHGNPTSLWRTISTGKQSDKTRPDATTKVIGASYSHADVLRLDSLSISGVSRGRLSPSDASRSSSRPPSSATTPTTTRHESYTGFVPGPNSDWLADHDADDTDQVLALDDGEDEFGLPTIANLRKKAGRRTDRTPSDSNRAPLPFTHTRPPNTSLEPTAVDNGDIAEERGLPQYPSAKKAEGKILRPQYKDILRDPANSLHLISHAAMSPDASSKDREAHDARIGRINKFKRVLQMSSVPNNELRDLAWSGVPQEVRAMSWQILLNYLPLNAERRVATLERKRKEYQEGVHQVFEQGPSEVMSPRLGARPPKQGSGRGLDEVLWHQISIDVPRTNPHLELYSYEATQRSLERILYVWAIRHPASGYVQGINDLVTPFWQVFLASYITDADIESGMDPGQLPKPVLDAVEADTFWCLTKLLDGVQDNYIVAQPGITRQVGALRDLTTRIDERLAKHLDSEGIEFIQFSFRWMNCLLMRELSVRSTIRMWDTYLAEEQGFSQFHLYVCAAFLVKWSDQLLTMDFQGIMMFLQSLPTKAWTEKDIELLLSEAFIWQSLFRGSKAHIQQTSSDIVPLNL